MTGQHQGFFAVNKSELEGSSASLAQSGDPCTRVKCECGWSLELDGGATSLQDAKAALAQHQHNMLEA